MHRVGKGHSKHSTQEVVRSGSQLRITVRTLVTVKDMIWWSIEMGTVEHVLVTFKTSTIMMLWHGHNQVIHIIKVKVYSYIARYPVLGTVQSTLHFTPWQTCSFQRHLDFSGKPCCNYCMKTIRSHIHLCLYCQVLIYTAEWTKAMWGEQKCLSFETAARRFEPGFSWLRVRCSNHRATAHNKTLQQAHLCA